MTTDDRELTPAYISLCKCGCGGIIMAAVDRPEYAKDVAQDVAEAIREGYKVEHVTVGYVHQHHLGCLRKVKQDELPTGQ
jgi:hypothetical protein